jgi:hypothetical protein
MCSFPPPLDSSRLSIAPHLICNKSAIWDRWLRLFFPSALDPWIGLVRKETYTPRFGHLDKPERTPELTCRAFTMPHSGRSGPVILAIPNATATYDEVPWRAGNRRRTQRMCALQLTSAWEPDYAGEGVIYAGASGDLEALTELVNVPVITQVAGLYRVHLLPVPRLRPVGWTERGVKRCRS